MPEPSIDPASAVAPVPEPYPAPGRAWYAVGVLTLVYVFSFIDRQVLNLLVKPIRRDLDISDTQMSLLMGFSFAVFYTFFGIPLGRLADSHSRRTIIAVGFVFWSAMTAGCGLAKSFGQMLLLRMGVGVGEAALSPAAYSIIADSFPPQRQATAISVYSMGIYIGSGLAYLLTGTVIRLAGTEQDWDLPLVGATRPWQVIFFLVGLPGVLLALLMATVPEPARRGARVGPTAESKSARGAPLQEVLAYIAANRVTFLCHNLGFGFLAFSAYGFSAWVPTFFIRIHGWSAESIGIVYGIIIIVFGTLGIVAAGRYADWMAERGQRDATMRVGLIVSLIWFPGGILMFLVPSDTWAIVLLAIGTFLGSAPFGVAPAAIQQMMPNTMRGQAAAIYLFVVNLIGLGLGPTAVALTTDYVFQNDNAVNYSLLLVTAAAHVVSSLMLWFGREPFCRSLDYFREWSARSMSGEQ